MDSEPLQLFTEATRTLVADPHRPVGWTLLRESGWFDLMAESPETAAPLLLEELGRQGRASAAVDACVVSAVRAGGADLPDAPASYLFACTSNSASEGVEGAPLLTGSLLWQEASEEFVVLAPVIHGGARRLAIARMVAETSVLRPAGVDARSHVAVLVGQPAVVLRLLDTRSAAQAEQAARRAVGHELVGLAAGMLGVAVEHAKTRMQFGRAIGSFQAVKHRLADVAVAIEAARSALGECWRAPAESDLASLVATALSGEAAEVAIRNCLQVTGGIGFTEEFPLGALIRRTLMIESLFGGVRLTIRDVGGTLLREKRVPRLSNFGEL